MPKAVIVACLVLACVAHSMRVNENDQGAVLQPPLWDAEMSTEERVAAATDLPNMGTTELQESVQLTSLLACRHQFLLLLLRDADSFVLLSRAERARLRY